MWNTLLLEIFSVFPSAGIVGCFVFVFCFRSFFWLVLVPLCIRPVYPLRSLFIFLVLIYSFINQKKKKALALALEEEFSKLDVAALDVGKGTCLRLYCFTLYSASSITFRISTKFSFVTLVQDATPTPLIFNR